MGNQCLGGNPPKDAYDANRTNWNAEYRRKTQEGRLTFSRMTTAQSTTMVKLMRNKDAQVKSVNQYAVVKQIGKGSFGDVFLASAAGEKVAIKMLKKSALRRQRQGKFGSALDTVKAEIALMKKIRHPNCVGMIEVIDDPNADEVFIVIEYVDGGASQATGRDGLPLPLKEAQIWSHMRHLVLGLEYLHMNGIVHRDIKPENLLISRKDGGMLKIADFGTAVFAGVGDDSKKTAGTPAFFSPEMCDMAMSGKYDGRVCDMWAVGVTMFVWLYGYPPFMAATPMLVMEAIQACPDVVELPAVKGVAGTEGLKAVMQGLLTRDFEQRMTLNGLRLHPWLTKGGTQPLVTQPAVKLHVSEKDIQDAITPLMQVSGHQGALERASGTSLVKNTTREEYDFYQAISASDIASHAPILYGVKGGPGGNARTSRSTHLETLDEGDADQVRIIVQDLTAGMDAPCVMDIKMGIRTCLEADLEDQTPRADLLRKMDAINPREAKPDERKAGGITKARYLTYRDSLTSTSTLGFRIDAAVLSKPGGNERAPINVNFRELKDDTKILATFKTFLSNSKPLCRACIIKLTNMRTALERSNFFHRHALVRSSILVTYDLDVHAHMVKNGASAEDIVSATSPSVLEVKMIDFAHSHPIADGRTLTHRDAWTPGLDEDGYLTGVDSLVSLLEQLHTSMP